MKTIKLKKCKLVLKNGNETTNIHLYADTDADGWRTNIYDEITNAVILVNGFCDICVHTDIFNSLQRKPYDVCHNVSKKHTFTNDDSDGFIKSDDGDNVFYIFFSKKYKNMTGIHNTKNLKFTHDNDNIHIQFEDVI